MFMDLKNRPTSVSAPDVLAGANAVAQYLAGRGLEKNDKVVIMLPTGPNFAYVYFGILFAGGVPVPVSQPAGTNNLAKYLDNLTHIIQDCEAKFFITYEKIKVIAGSLMNISNLVKGFHLRRRDPRQPGAGGAVPSAAGGKAGRPGPHPVHVGDDRKAERRHAVAPQPAA